MTTLAADTTTTIQSTISTTATSGPAVTHLSGSTDGVLVGFTIAVVLLAGLLIVGGRSWLAGGRKSQTNDKDATVVRSWIAISLVAGLLIFCAVAFAIDDQSLRSTLFGGLVTAVGAAVAFYFSSKGADQARQDVMDAAVGTSAVPDIVGPSPHMLTVADAHAAIAPTSFRLVLDNPKAATTDTVVDQKPPAHTQARNDSAVTATTQAPPVVPDPPANPARPVVPVPPGSAIGA